MVFKLTEAFVGAGLVWILGFGLVSVLKLGVSGAITALGDPLFPVASLEKDCGRICLVLRIF